MSLLEKEWFVQAPWGRMCIVAWGDCYDPPVLLCHGINDSVISFRPLVKMLPKKFYYIGMDLPGCGKSDPMPPGLLFSIYDLLYSIQVVVKHFRWESFVFVGHSFGCTLGTYYNLSYPGKMSKVIDLDPNVLAMAVPVERFPDWYQKYFTDLFCNYKMYAEEKLKKIYTREEAVIKLMKNRDISREIAEELVTRNTEKIGSDLVRFTFDERLHVTIHPPFTLDYIKKIILSIKTPSLIFICDQTKYLNDFNSYLLNMKADNYKIRKVSGMHDAHVSSPDKVAPFISQFLTFGLEGLDGRAKL